MRTSAEALLPWLALDALSGVGLVRKLALIEAVPPQQLLSLASNNALPGLSPAKCQALACPDMACIDRVLAWLDGEPNHHILTLTDPRYPEALRHIADPPLLLFVAGEPEMLSRPAIAVVGSRNADPVALDQAHNWSRQLAAEGWLVVSGLAEGIDGAAHRGALEAGTTVAVQGCGLNVCYPRRHQTLAEQIRHQGALVSSFLPWLEPRRPYFPQRNRIVSGLSLGTLVVQANLRSGSLITARLASEQGREVFAIPGSLADPYRAGCHQLIQQGAKLVTQPVDITEELQPQLSRPLMSEPDHIQLPVPKLLDSVGYEATPVDVVIARSQLPVDQVLMQLTELELEGWVAAVPGGYVRLRG